MDGKAKWVGGGAVAATLLVIGVTLAGSSFTSPEVEKPAPVASASPTPVKKPNADPTAYTIKRVLPIEGPIKYGDWYWDDKNVPDGPLRITVDLQARTISIFRDGYEIGTAAVMLGTDETPTPTGTFPILSKERHNVSEKYSNAPMPWTLRLTNDGIAIHGGATVENGYASHGCVAIPNELASKLFDVAKVGDKVIITDGERIGVGDPIA